MKRMPRLFSVLIVLIFCMTLAVPVLAVTDTISAGIYNELRGTYTVDTTTTEFLTITTVTTNPDRAYLRTKIAFSNGLYTMGTDSELSARGALRLSSNFPVPLWGEFPNYVFTTHEVYGGTVSPTGYAVYLEGDISFFDTNMRIENSGE